MSLISGQGGALLRIGRNGIGMVLPSHKCAPRLVPCVSLDRWAIIGGKIPLKIPLFLECVVLVQAGPD